MTAVDHGAAQTAIPQQAMGADGSRPAGPAGSKAAGSVTSAASAPATALPRDPQERLAALFDPGTLEILPIETEERGGVVAGAGLVHGANVVAFASDPRVQGGAMGTAGCAAIVGAYAEALSRGVPVVGLWHSGGARLAEGVASLHAVGTVFAAMTRASGRIPQISVVLGPAAGGAAYGPALTWCAR